MSAHDSASVLKPILLRSSTPAPNEKVMRYLESMTSENQPDDRPPRSIIDHDEYRSNMSHRDPNVASPQSRARTFSPGKSNGTAKYSDYNKPLPNASSQLRRHDDEIDGDDADSNLQDGLRSELGDIPLREPGPNDPPGPKYESYDSGPSFGNFGPFPPEDRASLNPYGGGGGWNPDWSHIREGDELAGVPTEEFGSSKVASRVKSQVAGGGDRPFSPGMRSKVAGTEKGTTYPPLPESALDYGDQWDAPLSPRSRAYSKAPSISPSDSASALPKPRAVQKLSNGHAQSRSPPPGSSSPLSQTGHQSRPFSPYRHAPTTEDLIHAAVRGRAMAIPEVEEEKTVTSSIAAHNNNNSSSKQPSQVSQRSQQHPPPSPQKAPRSATPSESPMPAPSTPTKMSKVASQISAAKSKTVSQVSKQSVTPSKQSGSRVRSHSPDGLDAEETRIINDALGHGHGHHHQPQTPRTSYYAASIEPGLTGHYHDEELCQLLRHENDNSQPEVVRKALRKAIRQRVKKLGMKYDTESIKQYKRSYHDHEHTVNQDYDDEPPRWATDLKRELVVMQQRIESLGPKIENLRYEQSYDQPAGSRFEYDPNDESVRTPRTQTVNIETQPTGTLADSMYHHDEMTVDDDGNMREFDDMTETRGPPRIEDGETADRTPQRNVIGLHQYDLTGVMGRDDSPGQQLLEEELYKLRQRPRNGGSQSAVSHRTWEIARNDEDLDYADEDDEERGAPSGLPTIPDTNGDAYQDRDPGSPPLPALPTHDEDEDGHGEEGVDHSRQLEVHAQGGNWTNNDYSADLQGGGMPPWQRIHSRLLSWAIIWPVAEFEQALNSTTRGHQVDEVALSIWSTQTYKRYVRARLTEQPKGEVDRLFVPPNMADAISNAVFNGRHGEACGMLRDLWVPFGLDGTPRLIVVLAKHRSDPNHWVVHRFSLPDGNLTTYDSYPERTLPDGRPLGWWFAIRIAWPSGMYPKPDNLVQKMVRLHRPMQLPIDNSVAAAGIWRNILMGSRAERSLDLERLRDLINTEVKNLKQRKHLGKLTVSAPRAVWDESHQR
ncbi:hypothetical protein FA15DRAFT_709093 [Coprinopsis marcescibilis]|uniref:Uncharacterized protein n=1 Tax=Coprinopsis marcescibilis TaxID=230819 RepID=A0A5C3KGV6_COPMA|nr:hypothetical protein FA15DRAFT_709093 [Coprinopsis marcescibilis]